MWAATEATAAGRAMAETAVAVARVAEVRAEGAAAVGLPGKVVEVAEKASESSGMVAAGPLVVVEALTAATTEEEECMAARVDSKG